MVEMAVVTTRTSKAKLTQTTALQNCHLRWKTARRTVGTSTAKRVKGPVRWPHSANLHSVFRGRMPFLLPNQQCQSTEGKAATNIKTLKLWSIRWTRQRQWRASGIIMPCLYSCEDVICTGRCSCRWCRRLKLTCLPATAHSVDRNGDQHLRSFVRRRLVSQRWSIAPLYILVFTRRIRSRFQFRPGRPPLANHKPVFQYIPV